MDRAHCILSPLLSPLHPEHSSLSPADDDDANSYENVLICKQNLPESGEAANPELGRDW